MLLQARNISAAGLALALGWALARSAFAGSILPQDVYVWQRAWTPPVWQAVQSHAGAFRRLIALEAEIAWDGPRPRLVPVEADEEVLRAAASEVGLAVRIGAFPGPFHDSGEPLESALGLVQRLLHRAATNGVAVRELQIDFDCAASQLDGYAAWIRALRAKITPLPLILTALPSWMRHPGFRSLVSAADGYVLQVHSLDRPTRAAERLSLCDPAAARKAVEQAGAFGVPFRVALPTYGYHLAFDANGQFIGLAAEGAARSWPRDAEVREVRADAGQMAELVREWKEHRPAAMEGIIWYRLPTTADRLNWSWITLEAVMRGREPQPALKARAVWPAPGLADIQVRNEGDLDALLPAWVRVRWSGADLLAADVLHGFEIRETGNPASVAFFSKSAVRRLQPGSWCSIGWVRLSVQTDLQLETAAAAGASQAKALSAGGGSFPPTDQPKGGSQHGP
ncbi:MAG: DUF3142 domain-containing protein [Verrucomicrobiota bacterium]